MADALIGTLFLAGKERPPHSLEIGMVLLFKSKCVGDSSIVMNPESWTICWSEIPMIVTFCKYMSNLTVPPFVNQGFFVLLFLLGYC